MTSAKTCIVKNLGGRPKLKDSLRKRNRFNLLLNDAETRAMLAIIDEEGLRDNLKLSGAEVIRRIMLPHIRKAAKRYGIAGVED